MSVIERAEQRLAEEECQHYSKLVKDLRNTERVCRDRMDGQVMLDAADAIEALQAQQLPKRDEIVRCRECKWYGIYEAKKDGTPDKRYSPSVCLREIYAKRRDPDWFCGDGKRKVQE